MKKFFLFFISVLICIGMMTSCSSDSDDSFDDGGEGVELTIGDGISLIKFFYIRDRIDIMEYPFNAISCYHSKQEWTAYAETVTSNSDFIAVEGIDWTKQTLVFIEHYDATNIDYGYCKVKKKGKKYIFDVGYKIWLTQALSAIGVLVVVDEPNVQVSDIKLNTVDGFDIPPAEEN